MQRSLPGFALYLDTLPLPSVVDYLALGVGECFVTLEPIKHPAIESRPVWQGRLVCLLPARHPLRGPT